MIDIREALSTLLARTQGALYVSTCGYISRDLYNFTDRDNHFYLLGSMGMAAPIGLGIALAQPGRQVVVLDGDGSFAMNLSCLLMVAEHRPNLVHVVLDNGTHESTGGQATPLLHDPVGLAMASSYVTGFSVGSREELNAVELENTPALVHVRCQPRTHKIGGRIEPTPPQLVARFRAHLASSN